MRLSSVRVPVMFVQMERDLFEHYTRPNFDEQEAICEFVEFVNNRLIGLPPELIGAI